VEFKLEIWDQTSKQKNSSYCPHYGTAFLPASLDSFGIIAEDQIQLQFPISTLIFAQNDTPAILWCQTLSKHLVVSRAGLR
jgi:hypothetical protein